MEKELCLPREYLSYSQMKLWLDDKVAYRARYYEGKEEHKSPELMFGSEMAKGLENGTIIVPKLEVYPVKEWRFKGLVGGVPFAAYVDTYWPGRRKFREYKTGKWAWTQKKVDEHMQLDVYSLCIEEKEGGVDDECHLDWLVTRNKKQTMEFDGHLLVSEARGIETTGEVITFARVIKKIERDRMREVIRSVANEISGDYRKWLTLNPAGTLPSTHQGRPSR